MKFSTISLFALIALLFGIISFTSCSRSERFAGQWQGNPERLIAVPGASDANMTISLDFAPDLNKKGTGSVIISAVVEVEQSVVGSPTSPDQPYEASVAATASISGRYACTDDDDDDLALTFDPTTMQVLVDPSGVTFSQNILTGMQQPVLDSLSKATVEHWRVALTPAVREVFNRYRTIDDIKVHHGEIMSCEVADRDYTFRRVGVPD